jgi:hypothetical protein
MRHPQMLWGQSIEGFLKNMLEEQRKRTDEASGKGCRGRMRRSRKKPVSDMGGMLAAANNASAGDTDAGVANQTNNGAPMALARKAVDGSMETSTTAGAIGAV